MDKQLWADIPLELRFVRPWTPRAWLDHPSAPHCPYAVRDSSRRGYYQCSQVCWDGKAACGLHLLDRPGRQANAAILRKHAAGALYRHAMYATRLRTAEAGVAWVRALTDDDILELDQVGPVVAEHIRAIRDTWTDDQIAKILRLPPAAVARPAPPDPADFWIRRHDVFSLVGG